MKAYKFILMSCLLIGILTLFGIILAGAFGRIVPEVAMGAGISVAVVDFFLLIAAKSTVEAELKIAAAKRVNESRTKTG